MGTEERGPGLRAPAGAADSIHWLCLGDVPMRRWSFFVYGVVCHLLFLATFACLAGFVGNLLVPRSIDTATVSPGWALLIDLGLIALFALQHSIMARPWFKCHWTRLVPQ